MRTASPFPSSGLLRPGSARLLLGLLVLTSLAGCRGEQPEHAVPVEVDIAVAPTPPVVGPARVVLAIRDSVGAPLDDVRVRVEATMDHPGMVGLQEEASGHGEGRYVVPALEFDMAGDWILTVFVELPDGREAVREQRLRVASGPGPGVDP